MNHLSSFNKISLPHLPFELLVNICKYIYYEDNHRYQSITKLLLIVKRLLNQQLVITIKKKIPKFFRDEILHLCLNTQTTVDLYNKTKVRQLILSEAASPIRLPKNIRQIYLHNDRSNFKFVNLPLTIERLQIHQTRPTIDYKSLKKLRFLHIYFVQLNIISLPTSLKYLTLSTNDTDSVIHIPSSVKYLNIMGHISNIHLHDNIIKLKSQIDLTKIKLPSNLEYAQIVYNSDIDYLSKLRTLIINGDKHIKFPQSIKILSLRKTHHLEEASLLNKLEILHIDRIGKISNFYSDDDYKKITYTFSMNKFSDTLRIVFLPHDFSITNLYEKIPLSITHLYAVDTDPKYLDKFNNLTHLSINNHKNS